MCSIKMSRAISFLGPLECCHRTIDWQKHRHAHTHRHLSLSVCHPHSHIPSPVIHSSALFGLCTVRRLKECKPRKSLKIDTADHPHSLTSLSPNTHAQRTHITNHIYTTPSNRTERVNSMESGASSAHAIDPAHVAGRTSTSSDRDSFSLRPTFMQKYGV